MPFVEPKIEVFTEILSKLNASDQPVWGSMSAQRMVEHLSDAIDLSIGKLGEVTLRIPEDKVDKAIRFILSDYPLPKDFRAFFAKPETPLRNGSTEEATSEFESKWNEFLMLYKNNPNHKQLHPYFGELDIKLWLAFHSKHFTHHFEQFNLV